MKNGSCNYRKLCHEQKEKKGEKQQGGGTFTQHNVWEPRKPVGRSLAEQSAGGKRGERVAN